MTNETPPLKLLLVGVKFLDIYKNYQNKVHIIGHKNPDTDSICSAIAYANLKNQISEEEHIPRSAGLLNE